MLCGRFEVGSPATVPASDGVVGGLTTPVADDGVTDTLIGDGAGVCAVTAFGSTATDGERAGSALVLLLIVFDGLLSCTVVPVLTIGAVTVATCAALVTIAAVTPSAPDFRGVTSPSSTSAAVLLGIEAAAVLAFAAGDEATVGTDVVDCLSSVEGVSGFASAVTGVAAFPGAI